MPIDKLILLNCVKNKLQSGVCEQGAACEARCLTCSWNMVFYCGHFDTDADEPERVCKWCRPQRGWGWVGVRFLQQRKQLAQLMGDCAVRD